MCNEERVGQSTDPDYTPTAEMVAAGVAERYGKRFVNPGIQQVADRVVRDILAAARKVDPLVGEVERLRSLLAQLLDANACGILHAESGIWKDVAALNPKEAP